MKHKLFLRRFFASCLLLAVSTLSWAYDFEVDGFSYYKRSDGKSVYLARLGTLDGNSVTIPASVSYDGNKYSVTIIGARAFEGCSFITSITIPNSVTSIEYNAFYGCNGLTYINIPNSVTSIGEGAFSGCSGLTSVTIGSGVTSIGTMAFYGCSSLNKVEFASIESLCKISFEELTSNPLYYARHLYIGGQEVKDVIIPNSVTSIGSYAFEYCSDLTSISIPTSVTSIGNYAFSGCSGLTSITIPNSVTSIGEYAFWHCSGLTSVTIPNRVSSIGEGAFSGCSSLTSITIPNSVTTIGDYAFYDCSSLTSVTIPNSARRLGEGAFSGCSGLTSVTIGNSVSSIGKKAFSHCSSLTSVVISSSVTIIEYLAFEYCSNLTSVICLAKDAPEIRIGSDVFYRTPLTTVTLYVPKASLNSYKTAYEWKRFGTITPITAKAISINQAELSLNQSASFQLKATFEPNYASQVVTWTSSNPTVATVDENGLVTAIAAGVTTITATTTDGTSLSATCKVTVTNFIESGKCGENANFTLYDDGRMVISGTGEMFNFSSASTIPWLYHRNDIKLVMIGDGVTHVGDYSFYGCPNVTSIKLSNSVASIGSYAFQNCSGLIVVDDMCYADMWVVDVLDKTKKDYVIKDGTRGLANNAFSGCSNLKSVTCLVKETGIDPSRYAIDNPVIPLPGVDPSFITEYFYPFNPAHPDDPTTANVDETVDVTIDNVYPADECKAKWLDYYKKVYNNRAATSKTNTKWTILSYNPYIKRSDS